MAYIITYDLDAPGQNYDKLIKKIKTYHWAKLTESCWCITSSKPAKDIRDDLNSALDKNDKLFVAKLSGESAWTGLSSDVSNWLKNNL